MKKEIKFPNLQAEMSRNGETQEAVANLLGLTRATIGHKLKGKAQWTIGEIETLCEHYKKDYYELFK